MNTKGFKSQGTPTTCSIAVIRAIKNYFEDTDVSEEEILKNFLLNQSTNGTDINSITSYWKSQSGYVHDKKDEQTPEEMAAELEKKTMAMVILNTPTSGKFHCVLFTGLDEGHVSYWDPEQSQGDKRVSKSEFENMRRHDQPTHKLREVHYINKRI